MSLQDVSEAVPVELDRPAVAASPPLLETLGMQVDFHAC